MKLLLIFTLIFTFLHAENLENNSTQVTVENNVTIEEDSTDKAEDNEHSEEDMIIVKDQSGLSDDAVREKAKKSDKEKRAKVSVADVVESIDEAGNVDITSMQEKWEDLSPTPVKYDWVKTKSGEWFKGEIKGLYDDKLEFDSDEVGLYSFKFDDVREIKSYNIISLNIENLATFPGVLRMKGNKVTIIQGENSYDFEKKDVISFAPDGDRERNFWSGKATISFDFRTGNINQYDYAAKINLKRSTASTRLSLDYLGRVTKKDKEETANDHRINQKYDRYLSRHFFWTPVFSELYIDQYKNIDKQLTVGLGVGYTLIDTDRTTWSVSGGPAFLYTKYATVLTGSDIDNSSIAAEASTKYELEISDITDITFDYKLTLSRENAGKYKHHMVGIVENELTSWLDIDITGIWDFILDPETTSNGNIPDQNDFQVLIGLGMEF